MSNSRSDQHQKAVSLILGSGGARGLAHIGVIRWLEENNYAIQSIAGCSIGSLIGGVYAANKLDELEDWMRSIDKMDMASLLDLAWNKSGLFKGDRIINKLKDLLEDIQFEDLSIPFAAVAANIVTEKEVWIKSGSLFDAIRASVSLPLFFTPVEYEGGLLIDGGILNPVPVKPALQDETDLTVAVNLGGDLTEEKREVKKKKENVESNFQLGLKKFIASLGIAYDKKKNIKKWGMYDVADKAFNTMQGAIARSALEANPPDVEIKIARNACGTFEFDRAAEMISLGYKKAGEAFDQTD